MENEKPQRKRGKLAGPKTFQYTVLLDAKKAEWGKTQPGGLSALVRRLLEEEYTRWDKRVTEQLREIMTKDYESTKSDE